MFGLVSVKQIKYICVVIRLHDGDLHDVGLAEGPWVLVIPVKAIRVGVVLYKTRKAADVEPGLASYE